MTCQFLSDYCVSGHIFSGFLLLHLMRYCTHAAKAARCVAWCISYTYIHSYNSLPNQDRTSSKLEGAVLSPLTHHHYLPLPHQVR